jgi:lipoprotein-anchoring transpeptidase ErfK/SrfK
MLLSTLPTTAFALALIAASVWAQPAFSATDDSAAPSTEATPAAATPPASAVTPSASDAAAIEAPKPKPRKPRAAAAPTEPGPVNLFGEFSLLRLFGISAIPRSTVAFPNKYKPGTIVIHTNERRLYLVLGNGEAMRYGIGVGREGFTWRGVRTITDKREWPSWTPPPEMLKRQPKLPRHMVGGRDNPLGARAMYLGDTLYRIHGTNEYNTIGTANSSGCIRLTNEDVIDLYGRVRIGATVIVQ